MGGAEWGGGEEATGGGGVGPAPLAEGGGGWEGGGHELEEGEWGGGAGGAGRGLYAKTDVELEATAEVREDLGREGEPERRRGGELWRG